MSQKLPMISGKEAVKAFTKAGWHLDRISGSHMGSSGRIVEVTV